MNGPLLQQPWLFWWTVHLALIISWSLAWPPTQQGSAKAPARLDQDHLTESQTARIEKPILRQFAAPRALKNMLAQVKGSVPFATFIISHWSEKKGFTPCSFFFSLRISPMLMGGFIPHPGLLVSLADVSSTFTLL